MLKSPYLAGIMVASAIILPSAAAQAATTAPGYKINKLAIHKTAKSRVTQAKLNVAKTGNLVRGKITSISGTTISLTDKNNTAYTIDASQAKTIRRFGASTAVANLQVGDMLSAHGTLNGTTLTADWIRDVSLQGMNSAFLGKVTAVNGSSFAVQTKGRGTLTINTDAATVFKKGTLTDVAVGKTILAKGVWDTTNKNLTAKTVTVMPQE